MVRDSARQMLQAIPRHMAQGGAAGSFSDDEVSKFIQDTYAQFGGPGVEAHRVIADAMAQFGVGVDQVSRVSGYSPQEVQAEIMGQQAAAAQREAAQQAAAQQQVLPPPTPTPAPTVAAQRVDELLAQQGVTSPAPVAADPVFSQQGSAEGVSAAYRKAAQAGGQQTVDDYYANLRADAAAYLANPNAPTGVDAYNLMIESGISTSDLKNAGVADAVLNKIFTTAGPIEQSAFVTPAGMSSAYERSPDLSFEAQRLDALGQDGRGVLDQQGREYIANLQQGGIDAAERAQMLEYATERGYTFDDLISAGVDPNVLFTQAAPVTPPPVTPPQPQPTAPLPGTPIPPFVPPPYTPPEVYKPIEPQPDIFAPGEPALDVAFRASPPRTPILDRDGKPTGQFDYTPAAKLRPATGSGFSFTPPSVTTRPRSLLSPRDIAAYGGLTSASQRFAQNRALIDRNLRDMLNATPALRNASTYNLLRNQVMSGRFGPDPNRVFDPATSEGEQFQAYLASLAGAAPTQGATKGTGSPIAAGGGVTVMPDIDPTDRQMNAAGIGSNVVGGADPGGFGATTAKPLVYGGYGNYPLELFNKGGEATSSKRMLENLTRKKSEGSARDELARFQEGGEAFVGGSAPAVSGRMGRSARMAAQRAEEPQSESRTMLERLGRFTSLDTPQDMGLGETAADIGMGFLPVVGTAQGARDFERARRDEDNLGMLLSAASMIPVAGGAVRAIRSAGRAADVVEEVPGAARQMLDEVAPPATTEQIKQVEASAPTEKSPVPSYYMDEWTQETGLSPQEIENFWRLGDNQRGLPEHLMMKAQRTLGGGVLVPAIEHIGDLTNRMTPNHSLGFAYEETLGKAQNYLRSLKNKYGFRREFEENLRNNAQFNNESLGEHRSKVNAALDAYADAHEKLVTYNPLQTLARDAAVSLGRRDFEKAETLLQDFVNRIPTREDFVAEMRVAQLSSRELSQKLQAIQEKRRARAQR